MRGPGRWWRRQSKPEKVETYTRWSFHSFAVVEFVTIGIMAVPVGAWPGAVLLLTVAVHVGVCFVTVSRALDWTRGRRPQPVRLLWTLAAVTSAVGLSAMGIADGGPDRESVDAAAGGTFGAVIVIGTGVIALGVRGRRRVFAIPAAFAAGSFVVAFTRGAPVGESLFASTMVLFGGGILAFTAVVSVWLLNIVYELDEARETRARLAVAEERLRFGRDLHDVMGRNLAVIALKSELAVQLAQRDRPEAVAQMVEVQRLAQESQREVREVVRGYREADLASELAGAQGVLTAAGIDCTVSGATAAGLPVAVQSALGWVVREAATNVLRHGDARRCAVRLRMSEGHVVLSVENDGVTEAGGGPSGSSGSSGSGIAGLRERLAEIDGTLEAGPAGKGLFRLTAEIPLPSVPARSESVAVVRTVSEVTP
ncbi:sensor histidine kinase [Streptomyces coeruleorubidus]|uniref:sensor histidine kinase n=1 Tax=Streptomyces coeruleorubidus TaxID=116188 RepID=UPI0033F1D3B9